MDSDRRSALATGLLALFGIASALALAEVALRVLPTPDFRLIAAFEHPPWQAWVRPGWQNPPNEAYRSHPVLGYEHAPDFDAVVPLRGHPDRAFRFRTNGAGLRRDTEVASPKGAGLRRVLVLGDSHTDGYVNNRESFSTRLEALLADSGGGAIEVINGGVVGYSTAQQLLWYREHGARLDPDLVLAVFYVGNDAHELRDPSKPTVDLATGRALAPLEGRRADGVYGPGRLADVPEPAGSHLVGLARYLVHSGPLAETWRKLRLPGHLSEAGGFPLETVIEVLQVCHGCFWQSLKQVAYARRYPDGFREDLRFASDLLIRLDREVRADGGRLLVAVLPTRSQVERASSQPALGRSLALLGLDEADLAVEDEVLATLLGRLREASVPALSLREPLRAAAARDADLYYRRDWHLAPDGHRSVSEALADPIRAALE